VFILTPKYLPLGDLVFLEKKHFDFGREKKEQANRKCQKGESDSCPVFLLGKLRIEPIDCHRPDEYPNYPSGITFLHSENCQQQIENDDAPQVDLDIL
jgi:hypothetical protein